MQAPLSTMWGCQPVELCSTLGLLLESQTLASFLKEVREIVKSVYLHIFLIDLSPQLYEPLPRVPPCLAQILKCRFPGHLDHSVQVLNTVSGHLA